ncbi:MAG TPA: Hsp20/alpha crystallin family protein [Anaerolineae bacterium]|nr:Hsp20/alpha crystallin family protein [Anaerolineae bacterium]HNU05045.1 Hsp20/alpha crystallin family protein [Anaerolineae bacterium]
MTRVITRWEPARDFVALRHAMDRMFEEGVVQPSWTALARQPRVAFNQDWRLPLDVYSTPEEIVLLASTPGVDPESVEITFEGDVLTIKGEIPGAFEGENVEYLMQERRHGRFSRTLSFNVPINADAIEASFDKGVLTIVAPKAETVKPKTIKVTTRQAVNGEQ